MARLPVSACLIVKNEEQFLKACLESVAGWVSEIVICDSGSQDQTKLIAEGFRTQVPEFQWLQRTWTDDYSAARNFTAARATHSWILFIDGDEWLDVDAPTKIAAAINDSKFGCYGLRQINYSRETGIEESHRRRPPNGAPITADLWATENWMERLFRKDLNLFYTGRIHESLLASCQSRKVRHKNLDVSLHHFGRLKSTLPQKINYYLQLTQQKLNEEPHNPAAWIEMVIALMETQRHEQAFVTAQQAAQKFSAEPEILKIAFQASLRQSAWVIAERWINDYLKLRPDDLYALSQLTTSLLYQQRFQELCHVGQRVLNIDPENFVVHVNLATYFFEIKDWATTARHIASALKQKPDDEFLNNAMTKIPADFQIR